MTAPDPIEVTYVRACVAALQAKRRGDDDQHAVFSAVAYAIEAAWPDAVKRARAAV